MRKDKLLVEVFENRAVMGRSAAAQAAARIGLLMERQAYVNIIFAAAPSQNEFLEALCGSDVDWSRVRAFHMDEYIGLQPGARQSFGIFLRERLFNRVRMAEVHYINGSAEDAQEECRRYAALLARYPADIVCMGIGENGHIAFNDPPVADFKDPLRVKVVELDAPCRQQQVNDGCFPAFAVVPTHALTLTVPALMAGRYVYCMVPGPSKAAAVYKTLTGEIAESCPASILRRHPQAILYLDKASGSQLKINAL